MYMNIAPRAWERRSITSLNMTNMNYRPVIPYRTGLPFRCQPGWWSKIELTPEQTSSREGMSDTPSLSIYKYVNFFRKEKNPSKGLQKTQKQRSTQGENRVKTGNITVTPPIHTLFTPYPRCMYIGRE